MRSFHKAFQGHCDEPALILPVSQAPGFFVLLLYKLLRHPGAPAKCFDIKNGTSHELTGMSHSITIYINSLIFSGLYLHYIGAPARFRQRSSYLQRFPIADKAKGRSVSQHGH